jgi:hypothetical protein
MLLIVFADAVTQEKTVGSLATHNRVNKMFAPHP